MKANKKKTIYICQISDNFLKATKCLRKNHTKREFVGAEVQALPEGADASMLKERVSHVFRKLRFHSGLLILSLPANHVRCRYLRVPTQDHSEIQKIISLQASTYLPYPAEELITAYQVISVDKEGYAYINVIIAPKDLINRYTNILKALRPAKLTIILSAYGLSYFFNYLKPNETGPTLVIDLDAAQADLAVVSKGRLVLSRYFKLPAAGPQLEGLFLAEINKTKKAYSEEVSKEPIAKVYVFGAGKIFPGMFTSLSQKLELPFEVLSCDKAINQNVRLNLPDTDYSFVNLLGFGIQDSPDESLNLIPAELKDKAVRDLRRRHSLRLTLALISAFIIFGIAALKNLDNKGRYLDQLKAELGNIEGEAKTFEALDKRLRLFKSRMDRKGLVVDILYELHQLMPPGMFLDSFSYEEDKQIILKGQAPSLNLIFECVSKLEKSPLLRNFSVKIKYTTKKVTSLGEAVDYQIDCLKKI